MGSNLIRDFGLLDIAGTSGQTVIAEATAARDARLRHEQQVEAERQQAYEAASKDRAILTFDHWLDNPYYSGSFAADTHPVIRRIANEIFERGVYEILLRGASGYGKTWLAQLVHKYSLYYLTTFVVPQKAFIRKLAVDSPIVMINLNITETRAKSSYFSTFRSSVENTGYFTDQCKLRRGLLNRVEFVDKKIVCYPMGAGKHATESENLILCVLDEVNFYEDVEKSRKSDSGDRYDEAQVIDSAVTHRQENRFMNPDGSFPLPVKKILLCKETYPESYTARRDRTIKEHGMDKVDGSGRQRAMVVHMAEWESKPKHYYISKALPAEDQWFWVVTGTRTMPARIIIDKRRASEERKRIQRLKDEGADDGLVPELIKAPTMGGSYVDAAKLNIDDFIRDVCGRPTEAIDMYLKDRTVLTKAKELRRPGQRWPWVTKPDKSLGAADVIPEDATLHPFTAEETDLNDGVTLVKRRLVRAFEETGLAGEQYVAHRPIAAPGAPRFMHLDMGLSNDAAGLAVVAIPGMKQVTRWSDDEDGTVPVLAPWLWPDLVMRFVPPRDGGQIRFSAIQSLVRELVRLGVRIVAASADGYQSDMLLQWCEEQYDMDAQRVSLDKTPDGYNALQRALTEQRLALYEHTWLEGELRTLERKRGKRSVAGNTVHFEWIDHTPSSSKDASDALAGAVWHAEMKANEYTHAPIVQAPIAAEVENAVEVKHRQECSVRDAMRDGRLEDVFDMTGGFGDDRF